MNNTNLSRSVKPFLKWAGGKSQLIGEIEKYYPFESCCVKKYAEPFVGGGAVLFDILSKYNLDEIFISDTNAELINAYNMIKKYPEEMIKQLKDIQERFNNAPSNERNSVYFENRNRFNYLKVNGNDNVDLEKAVLMIFLNKTCFNGLYRVNRKGLFNVPIGSYKNPLICDEDNLRSVSRKLQNVTVVCGDYRNSEYFIDDHTFVYFDPPYRPITETSGFTAYTENLFSDEEQIELANYINILSEKGAKIVVSNSDPKNSNSDDGFFDDLYSKYNIRRVEANRMINCNGESRGKVKELIISNICYDEKRF